MMRFPAIALLLLLTGTLVSAFDIGPVKTEPSSITVPDEYPTIQEALNSANDGDTVFVRSGVYWENVVVNKSVTLVGESKETVIFQNYTFATVEIRADNVTFQGFTVENTALNLTPPDLKGILLNSSSNCEVIDNTVGPGLIPTGIAVKGGSANRIVKNEIVDCAGNGISVTDSASNTIMQNTMATHSDAFRASRSNYNRIFNNFFSNHLGVGFCISLSRSNSNIVEGNTLFDGSFEGLCRLELSQSNNNSIFHNNFSGFLSSNVSVDEDSRNNLWDNGYSSGGNYWIDYVGSDSDEPATTAEIDAMSNILT